MYLSKVNTFLWNVAGCVYIYIKLLSSLIPYNLWCLKEIYEIFGLRMDRDHMLPILTFKKYNWWCGGEGVRGWNNGCLIPIHQLSLISWQYTWFCKQMQRKNGVPKTRSESRTTNLHYIGDNHCTTGPPEVGGQGKIWFHIIFCFTHPQSHMQF